MILSGSDIIERTCRHAARFAEGFEMAGYRVLNEVVLNQVLVSFGDEETTRRVIDSIQADGTCWCNGTVWQDQPAMRISVCSWATTEADVERSLSVMLRAAAEQDWFGRVLWLLVVCASTGVPFEGVFLQDLTCKGGNRS